MRAKVIVAGLVLIAVLLFAALPFTGPPQDIIVRHVKSVQSSNITTMTFEIKNHSTTPYIFFPSEVQVRNSNTWYTFQGFDSPTIQPVPSVNPNALASYAVIVTNLPAASIVRFSMHVQKTLLGVNGFVRRAELNLTKQGGGVISLNPYDKSSQVFGLPIEVVSEVFVETGK